MASGKLLLSHACSSHSPGEVNTQTDAVDVPDHIWAGEGSCVSSSPPNPKAAAQHGRPGPVLTLLTLCAGGLEQGARHCSSDAIEGCCCLTNLFKIREGQLALTYFSHVQAVPFPITWSVPDAEDSGNLRMKLLRTLLHNTLLCGPVTARNNMGPSWLDPGHCGSCGSFTQLCPGHSSLSLVHWQDSGTAMFGAAYLNLYPFCSFISSQSLSVSTYLHLSKAKLHL